MKVTTPQIIFQTFLNFIRLSIIVCGISTSDTFLSSIYGQTFFVLDIKKRWSNISQKNSKKGGIKKGEKKDQKQIQFLIQFAFHPK